MMLEYAVQAAKLLLLAYLGIVLLLYFAQGYLIFPATRDLYRTPAAMGWSYQDIVLPVMGESTHGWYIPLEDARATVLFSHGNAGNIADRLESIALLREFGFNVLAYDYGGYGQSTGKASEKRCYEDVRAMWQWLTQEHGVPEEQIVLFGRSLGAAVTLDLAAEVKPAAVIAESAFTSTLNVAREIYWWLPVRFFLKHRFENDQKIGRVQAPILIIHSPEDEVIPYPHGKALFSLAPEPKQFIEIRGGHNSGFVDSASVYRAGWKDFLDRHLPAPAASGATP